VASRSCGVMTHAENDEAERPTSQVKHRKRIIDARALRPRELTRERPQLTAKVFEFCLARQVARAEEPWQSPSSTATERRE
jgi:hypothetical protein